MLFFVSMILTSGLALKTLSVAMSTVIKSTSNIMILSYEQIVNKNTHSWRIWGTALLLMASATVAGLTDLGFNAVGYTWQFLNTICTVGYMLATKGAMKSINESMKNTDKKNDGQEFTISYYNNLLSL